MEVATVEGTLANLEHVGFRKSRKEDSFLFQLEEEAGSGYIQIYGMLDRCYLIICDVTFKRDFVYGYHIEERFLELCSVSDSQVRYEHENEETALVLKGMSFYINLGLPGVINIPAGTRLTYTSFVIRESVADCCLSPEDPDSNLTLSSNAALINQLPPGHRLARILSDVIHYSMEGAVKTLYYEIKAVEVLCLLSEALAKARECRPHSTVQDRAAVKRAIQILSANMSCPPSISTLARQVGTNATKLKQVFKQETGYTIFGYLRNIRLGVAVSLMADPGATITSVSQEVGYKSPSKFTEAFRQQYGLNPGKYLRIVRQRPG